MTISFIKTSGSADIQSVTVFQLAIFSYSYSIKRVRLQMT